MCNVDRNCWRWRRALNAELVTLRVVGEVLNRICVQNAFRVCFPKYWFSILSTLDLWLDSKTVWLVSILQRTLRLICFIYIYADKAYETKPTTYSTQQYCAADQIVRRLQRVARALLSSSSSLSLCRSQITWLAVTMTTSLNAVAEHIAHSMRGQTNRHVEQIFTFCVKWCPSCRVRYDKEMQVCATGQRFCCCCCCVCILRASYRWSRDSQVPMFVCQFANVINCVQSISVLGFLCHKWCLCISRICVLDCALGLCRNLKHFCCVLSINLFNVKLYYHPNSICLRNFIQIMWNQ